MYKQLRLLGLLQLLLPDCVHARVHYWMVTSAEVWWTVTHLVAFVLEWHMTVLSQQSHKLSLLTVLGSLVWPTTGRDIFNRSQTTTNLKVCIRGPRAPHF